MNTGNRITKPNDLSKNQNLTLDAKLKDCERELTALRDRLASAENALTLSTSLNNRPGKLIERLLAEAYGASPNAITISNLSQNVIVMVNDITETLVGYKPAELIGSPPDAMNIWVNKSERSDFVNWLNDKPNPIPFYATLRRKDGSQFDALIAGKRCTLAAEVYSITTIQDISHLKNTERQLQESNVKFSTIFKENFAPMFLVNMEPLLLDINEAGAALLEFPMHEVTTDGLNACWKFESERQTFLRQISKHHHARNFEATLQTLDGRPIPVILDGRVLQMGETVGVLVSIQDLTERRLQERILRKQRLDLEEAQEIAKLGSFEWDINSGKLYTSTMMQRLVGETKATQQYNFSQLIKTVHPEDRHLFYGPLRERYNIEYRLDQPLNGIENYHLIANVERDKHDQISHLQGILQDITHRVKSEKSQKTIQDKLLQTQKLESLGVLAGGIAHDFNNLLTTVMGNAELALLLVEQLALAENKPNTDAQRTEIAESLANIISASNKAADLTGQLLAYSGKGKFLIKPLCLSSLVQDLSKLFSVSMPENVAIKLNLEQTLPAFDGDQSQIQQVIMNLIINASEAIGDNHGAIHVNTSQVEASQYQQSNFVGEKPGDSPLLLLEVEDNGIGMTEETIEKMFEPFFTTKFTGRGLGMAAVLGIIRSHQGAISVSSKVGEGTRFSVYLPITSSVDS